MPHAPLEPVLRHVRRLAAGGDQTDGALLRAFVAANDQGAFTALVRRRGPMVLAVCRRVLPHEQDAEDAFQAAFLLLAQKAASLGQHESLAGWLHGVAWRMAKNARRMAARRRRHEGRARTMPTANPEWDVMWREVQAVLDEEVQRLPPIYREAFVLCCLGNQSGAEAARQLGVKEGTAKSRLAKARALLRHALARRGVSLTAVLAAAALSARTAEAVVPGRLTAATAAAAAVLAAGQPAATGALPTNVLALLKGVKTAMIATKIKTATAVALVLTVAAAGLALGLREPARGQDAPPPQPGRAEAPAAPQGRTTPPAAPAPEAGQGVEISGRVLDPAGKPVAGAGLYLAVHAPKGFRLEERGATDTDGRFRVAVPQAEVAGAPPFERGQLIATAAGYGPDWISLDQAGKGPDLTLRLVKDVPVKGRVLDVDGKPVAAARLRVEGVTAYASGGLDRGLEYLRQGGYSATGGGGFAKSLPGPLPGQPRETVTGADGRFALAGVGEERVVRFHIEGPSIQHWFFEVMTRKADAVRGPDLGYNAPRVTVYGSEFDYVAAASRPLRGTVRDKATGRPVAGVTVSGDASVGGHTTFTALTDGEGHYELLGYPNADVYHLVARPAEGQAFFGAKVEQRSTPGLDPVRADIDLVSGIPVSGHVREALTGKPVAGARVEYHPLYPNPFVARISYDRFAGASWATTGADGSYGLVALPGPGVLALRCPPGHSYMPALVTPEEVAKVLEGTKGNPFGGGTEHLITAIGQNEVGGIVQTNYQALALIKPGESTPSLRQDLAVHPGRTLTGEVLGPDGRPLAGATLNGAPLATASFTLAHLNPRRTQGLEFDHHGKHLGLYQVIRGDEPEPLRIRLQPDGSVVGRLLGKDGKPIPDVPMRVYDSVGETDIRTKTDGDGRFRLDDLIVGHTYTLTGPTGLPILFQEGKDVSFPPFTVEPGKVKDLGDAQVK